MCCFKETCCTCKLLCAEALAHRSDQARKWPKEVQGDQSFTAERLDNLEEQRRGIDRDLIVVRGRVESEAATQAARIARLEDHVAEIQHSLLARVESQSIAIARLSRRLQELEVQQR